MGVPLLLFSFFSVFVFPLCLCASSEAGGSFFQREGGDLDLRRVRQDQSNQFARLANSDDVVIERDDTGRFAFGRVIARREERRLLIACRRTVPGTDRERV